MPILESDISPFLPQGCAADICKLLKGHGVLLHVKRHRISKSGDFSVNNKTGRIKITVNGSLDKFAFLITIVHEIAHLYVWEKYSGQVKPHGTEWKTIFSSLLRPFVEKNIFPPEIERALRKYLQNPGASTSGNKRLAVSLLQYSGYKYVVLEQISDGVTFMLRNGLVMKKIGLVKTRYKCLCINNNRIYSVPPLIEVIPL